MEGEALFGSYLDVRIVPDGSRVYVLDSEASEVTIRKPDGRLIRRVGRAGEGPGEFLVPARLVFFGDGFYVKDDRRITTFTLDGELTGADAFPRGVGFRDFGVQYWAIFNDRSFMALSSPHLMDGSESFDPIDYVALLRVSQDGGSWGAETIARSSFRDFFFSIAIDGDPFPINQPWVAPDHFQEDPRNNSVVVSRTRTMFPGLVELTEISTAGDTLWTRRLQLPPIPLREDSVEAKLEERATMVAEFSGDRAPSPQLKRRIREGWIIPEYWPAVRQIRLMSNGEIWFRPPGLDGRRIWYAVRKGVAEDPIRKILAPASFEPFDVNDTHVWGVRYDELDVPYVAGLRLVRSS